jgi:hypothetical protein
METLKKHLPVSVSEGLSELQKIAVRFEEKIYTAATSQVHLPIGGRGRGFISVVKTGWVCTTVKCRSCAIQEIYFYCIKLPLLLLNKILIFIMLATHIEFICVVFILPLTCVYHVPFHVPGIEYILEATFC